MWQQCASQPETSKGTVINKSNSSCMHNRYPVNNNLFLRWINMYISLCKLSIKSTNFNVSRFRVYNLGKYLVLCVCLSNAGTEPDTGERGTETG